ENGVYLNETVIDVLGLGENPISFKMGEEEKPILGVMKDFNFKDLRNKIGPLMIRHELADSYVTDVFLKVAGKNIFQTVDNIRTTYAGLIGDVEHDIRFVDDTIDQWYEKEARTGKIIGYFTMLSFIISGMGILAMSTFYMQQRKKEIGIRKVNGSTIGQILSLLNKDFVKWVALAF